MRRMRLSGLRRIGININSRRMEVSFYLRYLLMGFLATKWEEQPLVKE